MSIIRSATSFNRPVDQTSTNILDNRFCRWSIGRADSVGRLAVYITAFAVQTIKVIGKSLLVGLSLNAGKYVEGLEEFSSQGLKVDVTFLGILVYKCAQAFKDILLAPTVGYKSTPRLGYNLCKAVLGGVYHMPKVIKAALISEIQENKNTKMNKKSTENTSDNKKPIRIQLREKVLTRVRLNDDAVNLYCANMWKLGIK